jgi:hypothetical protein
MMLKLTLNQMKSVAGREGLQGRDAERAISNMALAAGGELEAEEQKVLGSRRLARALARREADMARTKDDKNERLAFDSMINSLQSLFGRDGFRGKDAEKALKELKEVQIMAQAEEEDEQRLLGSKRVFKFVRAATRTIQRPLRRKNHPGEVYDSRSGHR